MRIWWWYDLKIYKCAISDACAYFQIAYKALDKDISGFLRVAARVVKESWRGFETRWPCSQPNMPTWWKKGNYEMKKMRRYVCTCSVVGEHSCRLSLSEVEFIAVEFWFPEPDKRQYPYQKVKNFVSGGGGACVCCKKSILIRWDY